MKPKFLVLKILGQRSGNIPAMRLKGEKVDHACFGCPNFSSKGPASGLPIRPDLIAPSRQLDNGELALLSRLG